MPDRYRVIASDSSPAIFDAHATIGANRDVELDARELIELMDANGVGGALISPAERFVAVRNREGNVAVAAAARASGGRLRPYAVANPWRGAEALDILTEAADLGASALKLDPALQGFDLLDGQVEPLLDAAQARGWPVYIRTGTPPHALPLPVAVLGRRFPQVTFVLGRSGATDFALDVIPALRSAPNLLADSAATFWEVGLAPIAADPTLGAQRIVFSSNVPFGSIHSEIQNVEALRLPGDDRAMVLGGTITRLLADQGET
jgi:predicted TIM-barrel fold metal-dependent hydrolase